MTVRKDYNSSCKTFKQLYERGVISKGTLAFARSQSFVHLSPVQEIVIPLFVSKRGDVAVEACTGSGKTLAYLIPCVEILRKCEASSDNILRVGAICLVPTRELTTQIHAVLQSILNYTNKNACEETNHHESQQSTESSRFLHSVALTGGKELIEDVQAIRNLHTSRSAMSGMVIVVATPGRLCSVLEALDLNRDWSFRHLEVLIFDEADRLFLNRASFEVQLTSILNVLPKQRQTGVFSATLTSDIKSLVKAGMRNPTLLRVAIHPNVNSELQGRLQPDQNHTCFNLPDTLTNYFVITPRIDKIALLIKFLYTQVIKKNAKCIVFFLTGALVNFFHAVLNQIKQTNTTTVWSTASIDRLYGKMGQKARINAYRRFNQLEDVKHKSAVLLATDVAARGLDFQDVQWIVQFDAPTESSAFIHRIGRTARAGKYGCSLLFVSPQEDACIPFLRHREIVLKDFSLAKTLDNSDTILQEVLHSVNLSQAIQLPSTENNILTPELRTALTEIPVHTLENSANTAEAEIVRVGNEDFDVAWSLLRTLILMDRDILHKASAAFVSFVRAYKEHELQYIFPFKALELGALATSLGLLRIPRVKEILGQKISSFSQSAVNPLLITFKDPQRQSEWERELAEKKNTNVKKKKVVGTKQLNTNNSDNETIIATILSKQKRTRTEKRQAKRQQIFNEWDELAREERLAKKLRAGKITLDAYESQFQSSKEQLLRNSTKLDLSTSTKSEESYEELATNTQPIINSKKNLRWLKPGRRGKKK